MYVLRCDNNKKKKNRKRVYFFSRRDFCAGRLELFSGRPTGLEIETLPTQCVVRSFFLNHYFFSVNHHRVWCGSKWNVPGVSAYLARPNVVVDNG